MGGTWWEECSADGDYTPDVPDHPTARGILASTVVVLALGLGGCVALPDAQAPHTVTVPTDAATIGEAVHLVAEGGMVLIKPGTYREQVVVDRPNITIRGLDRNETVIDGEGRRPYGIVATADGVTIQNLTVHSTTFYGILVTGMHAADGSPTAHGGDGYTTLDPEKFPPLQRFLVDHVTAYNNGLYGIYAFDAQHGVIRDSYASGSADSGFYVGQCRECDILVQGNVAERNAVGFENANASDSVTLVSNRFSGNRIGMTLISNYQEAFTPQHSNAVVGNLIADNVSAESPAHAEGGFGIGIGLAGAQDNAFDRNLIAGNPRAGALLENTEDLAVTGNVFTDSAFEGNGVDIANVSADRTPASGNCVVGAAPTRLPAELSLDCGTDAVQPAAVGGLPDVEVPPGMSFLRVPAPPRQPQLGTDAERVIVPGRLPDEISVPDLSAIPLPTRALLADRSAA
jgi:nitrous oxidase accessory protein NosD